MLFDGQAERFDDRAGLPAGVPVSVARAVLQLSGLQAGQGLIEIGAGTGEIGVHLARLWPRYAAFDISAEMLKRFPGSDGSPALRAQADGDAGWPIRSGSARAVFGSRSLHFMRPEHLASELARVSGGWGCLVLGKVERDADSVKEEMRHAMRELLREAGYRGRGGRRWREALWGTLGGRALGPVTVSAWRVSATPRRSLDAWAGKPGLAGLEVPAGVKSGVLERLQAWALERYGSLDAARESEERYVLEGIALP
jgi:SAM-dependent methyltransferase